MDQMKVAACVSKLRTLDSDARLACIYQWVLTKHIKLAEFRELITQVGSVIVDDSFNYIKLRDGEGAAVKQVADGILVDFDANDTPIGIEISKPQKRSALSNNKSSRFGITNQCPLCGGEGTRQGTVCGYCHGLGKVAIGG